MDSAASSTQGRSVLSSESKQHFPTTSTASGSRPRNEQQQPAARISTIPEESERKVNTFADKSDATSSSPLPNLVSATSGSASTPTSSIGNISSAGGETTASHAVTSSDFPHQLPKSQQLPQHYQSLHPNSSATGQHQQQNVAAPTAKAPGQARYASSATIYEGQHHTGHLPVTIPERSHPGGSNATAAMKLLVSNNVAGSIIGRAGQTISELQSASQTRIKLSQAGDHYPGTQDRVCLVQGEQAAVKVALQLLLERMFLLQENQHAPTWQPQQLEQPEGDIIPTFEFVVRLLVPISCCGMIIGKSGSNIKFMEETAGVTLIRLSPKDDDPIASTSERIVTISGSSFDSCLHCVHLVFNGLASHPEISQYSNLTTSYANCSATAAVTGSHQPSNALPVYGAPTGLMGTMTSAARHNEASTAVLMGAPLTQQHMTMVRHFTPEEQHQRPFPQFWEIASPSSAHFPAATTFSTLGQQQEQHQTFPRRINSSPDLPTVMAQQPVATSFRPSSLYEDELVPSSSYGDDAVTQDSFYSPLQTLGRHGVGGDASPAGVPLQPHQHQSFYGSPIPTYATRPVVLSSGQLIEEANRSLDQRSNLPYMPHDPEHLYSRHSFHQGGAQQVPHSASAPNLMSVHLEPPRSFLPHRSSSPVSRINNISPPTLPPPSAIISNTVDGSSAFTPQPPLMISPGCFNAQILIPDSMIGSVLGRGGQTLTELQILSGTRIRISQRGEYMPGTRSRIVTVRGPTAQTVWQAQFMISQSIVLPPTATGRHGGGEGGSGTVSGITPSRSFSADDPPRHSHAAATRISSSSGESVSPMNPAHSSANI